MVTDKYAEEVPLGDG